MSKVNIRKASRLVLQVGVLAACTLALSSCTVVGLLKSLLELPFDLFNQIVH
ncbi:MAG: hypothetical protein Q4F35_06370 [Akkermansia sp.]|nr:hypothetical protein [Akkermansia sp.]